MILVDIAMILHEMLHGLLATFQNGFLFGLRSAIKSETIGEGGAGLIKVAITFMRQLHRQSNIRI